MSNFITFDEAFEIVKTLNLKNINEWREWIKCNKQYRIPYNPDNHYKDIGWISWKSFLNKEFKMDFLTYVDAREIVKDKNIRSNIEFKNWIKNNVDSRIPRAPEITYKNKGWTSWSDFLSTDNLHSRGFVSYTEAVLIIEKLNLKSRKEYIDYIKLYNINLPTNPHIVYSDNWISFGVYLSSGVVSNSNKEFLTYEQAKKLVRKESITSVNSFRKWKNPLNIPSDPSVYYKDSWKSWGDFLGTKRKSLKERGELFISFDNAKLYLNNLGLKHKFDYHEYIENNNIEFLPKRPDYIYKGSWIGYLDYLNCDAFRSSYGERKIKQFLDDKNIDYEKEKKFTGCKFINSLPFDFFLIKDNICIEYDGEHHFHIVSKYGGSEYLERVKRNDKIKTNWCRNNNIKLIRIPYNKKNKIYEILNKELL
jgi:hypothetical protein